MPDGLKLWSSVNPTNMQGHPGLIVLLILTGTYGETAENLVCTKELTTTMTRVRNSELPEVGPEKCHVVLYFRKSYIGKKAL